MWATRIRPMAARRAEHIAFAAQIKSSSAIGTRPRLAHDGEAAPSRSLRAARGRQQEDECSTAADAGRATGGAARALSAPRARSPCRSLRHVDPTSDHRLCRPRPGSRPGRSCPWRHPSRAFRRPVTSPTSARNAPAAIGTGPRRPQVPRSRIFIDQRADPNRSPAFLQGAADAANPLVDAPNGIVRYRSVCPGRFSRSSEISMSPNR